MLSFVVLNMAKYTIIKLILIDFVPILFLLNWFEELLGGHSTSKKSQNQKSPKMISNGHPISIKSQVQKVPTPLGGVGGVR